MSKVRVRFAPSPTGFLHVGGARTAIFNWLFARRHGGVFVLRIEDTDRARSSDDMVQAILDGMAWLGMRPDEGPFFQSEARDRHVSDAGRLVEAGSAYRCFCSAETIKEQRAAAERAGTGYRYPRTCADLDPADSAVRAASGEPCVIRFRVPGGVVSWDDAVHERTSVDSAEIDDFVIVRSDGTPTYMLSVVSDDASTHITHVVRGDDHLSNTPKQILLYRALGLEVPTFAHLPLILGEDRKRLSKRHGAMSVMAYRDEGYLPETMFNFLALLGWSPGDDRQKMSRDELIEAFGFDGVGRSGAVFDLKKLEWLNGLYLADLDIDSLAKLIRPDLEAAGLWDDSFEANRQDWFRRVVAVLQPRARTLPYFAESGRPYLDPSDELTYDEKPYRKHLKADRVVDDLRAVRERLAAMDDWTEEALEAAVRDLAETRELSAGKLIHPIRLAVTGRGESPGIFEILVILGPERSLARIDRLVRHRDGSGSLC